MLIIPMDRETTVYVSIIYLIANLLHERAQEGLSSASAKYGRIKKLEYVALSECNNTNAHHLLISHTSGEDHPNDDMTGAVNPSMDSNPIVNNIGPDNTNQCDTTATIEGCS